MKSSIGGFTVTTAIAARRPGRLLAGVIAVADAAVFQSRRSRIGRSARPAHRWDTRFGALSAVGIGPVDGAVIRVAIVERAVGQRLGLGNTGQAAQEQAAQRGEC